MGLWRDCQKSLVKIGVWKFLRLPFDASHVRGGGLGETALPHGNSILPRRFESLRLALALTLYQKSGLLTEISRRGISAAGLSGLSLPDALYEHTNIRASATNLTEERSVATRCDLRRMRSDHLDYRSVHGRRKRQRKLVGKALGDRHDAP